MKDHKDYFAVDQMASVLGVSSSGYYDYLKRPPSLRECYNKELLSTIRSIFKESHETYGSPRIHAELIEEGYSCSRPRVARLMKMNGIQAKMYRKFHKTTKQSTKPYYKGQDLVQQNFSAPMPDSIWVADISYISCSFY
jgi:putative transposase